MQMFFSTLTIMPLIFGGIFFLNSLVFGNDPEEQIGLPLQTHFRNNTLQDNLQHQFFAPHARLNVNNQHNLRNEFVFNKLAAYTIIVGFSILYGCSALTKNFCLAETSKSFHCNPTLIEYIAPTSFFATFIKTFIFLAVFLG